MTTINYQTLKQQLICTYPQLVIFDLKEVKLCEIRPYLDTATIYDLTEHNQTSSSTPCLKRKYYLGNYNYKPLIVILEDYTTHDALTDQLVVTYNLYNAIVKHYQHMVLLPEMDQLASQLTSEDCQIHWIWFRDKDFYLPNKIMTRAKSWIVINPTFKFYLWTNLTDQHELDDFISKLDPLNQTYFRNGTIIVKYHNDTLAIVEQFCQRFESSLTASTIDILKHLYRPITPITTIQTTSVLKPLTSITTTTTIVEQPNDYKINRLFRVDLLRIIVLVMLGGIYADFNDTICLYPMKYLLTMYCHDYFMGTDYDLEHPIYRNNYFLYTSFNHPQFIDLGIQCLNCASREYMRIISADHIQQYLNLCLDLLTQLNHENRLSTTEFYILPIIVRLDSLKRLIQQDQRKQPDRVIQLMADLFEYIGLHWQSTSASFSWLQLLAQRIRQELSQVDHLWLKKYLIKPKINRRWRSLTLFTDLVIPFPIIINDSYQQLIQNYDYVNYFLLQYAVHMTNGDLILSTNIAYVSDQIEHLSLIPFSRSNRLSTISMITHTYDGTSYGLDHKYETVDSNCSQDLRHQLL